MKSLFSKSVNLQGKKIKFTSKALLLALTLLFIGNAKADIFETKLTGQTLSANWNDATAWKKTSGTSSRTVPATGDEAQIINGDIIIATSNITVDKLTFIAPGNNKTDSELRLSNFSLTVNTISMSGNVGNQGKRNILTVTTGVINISGLFTVDAVSDLVLGATSTVNFNGTSVAQIIPAYNYGKLQINGTSTKTLNGSISVATSLEINAPLDLNSKMLDASTASVNMQQTGSATNGSSTGYLKLAPGSKMIARNVGSAQVEFPVGTNSYTPAYISNAGTVNDFSVSISEGFLDAGITKGVVKKTWYVLNESNNGTPNVTLRLQWNASDELTPFNRNWCAVGHYNTTLSTWDKTGGFGQAENAGGAGPYNRTMSGITSFSPFGVGDGGSPLPVELVSFKAAKTDNGTALSWETASEKNNKGYDVQASADGKNFETVAFVASKNSNANYSQRYEFLDKTSRSGLVYYRLKQTDFDGTVAFYAAKVVDLGKFAESAVAYPNPFQNQFEVKLNGATSLEVTDLTGKVVYRGQIAPGTNNLNIDMNTKPVGVYLLKASAAGKTTITRLVKQ